MALEQARWLVRTRDDVARFLSACARNALYFFTFALCFFMLVTADSDYLRQVYSKEKAVVGTINQIHSHLFLL